MYEYQGLQDICFIMIYGSAMVFALISCIYLLFRRSNAFTFDTDSPRQLRLWTAAFMASIVGSHIWWALLGTIFLTDNRLIRNIVAITLDRLTFMPLILCVLLRMLQDRRRSLWPVVAAFVPLALFSFYCLLAHNQNFEFYTECYSVLVVLVFLIYYVYALHQYGRWLRDNFADLEHKEVWRSLLLFAFLIFTFIAYASNEGDILSEYLAQINTIIIVSFLTWRVETLQELQEEVPAKQVVEPDMESKLPTDVLSNLLKKRCEDSHIYLQQNLTLQQLADMLGTNRTYLGQYFAQQGITYNAYINGLRIEHFMRLYQHAADSHCNVSAQKLCFESGFRSYSTFAVAFKQYRGMTVSEWVRQVS